MTDGKEKPTKWWQWFLVYPTFALAILGAAPTFLELYKSKKLNVQFGDASKAVQQRDMWEKNLSCTTAPFEWLTTSSNVKVDATICLSGDVLIRVKDPDDQQYYEWVPVDDFFRRTTSFGLISSAVADEAPGEVLVAQNGIAVICQRWLDRVMLLRRVSVPGRGCFDEVVNTYSGIVVSQQPAPCSPRC